MGSIIKPELKNELKENCFWRIFLSSFLSRSGILAVIESVCIEEGRRGNGVREATLFIILPLFFAACILTVEKETISADGTKQGGIYCADFSCR